MNGVFQIFWFTFREQARKKSFIISTAITYILLIAVICLPAIISAFQGSSSDSSKTASSASSGTIYVIDGGGLLSGQIKELEKDVPGYRFVLKQPADQKALMNTVKNDGSKNLIVVGSKKSALSLAYYYKDINSGPDGDELRSAVKKAYGEKLLASGGVSQNLIGSAYADLSYRSQALGKGTVTGMLSSFAVTILLFMSIYMYGYWVAMSIASEKTSRVMEVLITSTKPSRIVIGKALGMGVLGLAQLVGLIVVGAATYAVAFPKNYQISGLALNLSSFSPLAVLMIIVYFIFGFSLFAMMYAVCGATISKAEDVQQAIQPVALIGVASYMISYMSMTSADSSVAMAVSLIPFTSPFSMPSRILSATVPAWQIALSLLLLAITTAIIGFISIRLYSSAVLHYGKRLKISELVKMSKSN
jgi:ABC-2 type transport system permease protein